MQDGVWSVELTCSSSAYGASVNVKERLLRDRSTGGGGGIHVTSNVDPTSAEQAALTSRLSSTHAFSSTVKAS